MVAFIDRLTEPRNIRRLVLTLIGFVVLALVLATVAIVRELGTAGEVERVERNVFNITNPSPAQLQRGIDRAIKGLTIRQRRMLLDRLLVVASPSQREKMRTRLRSLERRGVRPRRVPPRVGEVNPLRPVPPRVRRAPARARPAPVPRVAPPMVAPAPAPPPIVVPPVAQPFGPGKSGDSPGKSGSAPGHNKGPKPGRGRGPK